MPISVVIDLDDVVTVRALLRFLATLPTSVNMDEDLRYTAGGGGCIRGLAVNLPTVHQETGPACTATRPK